MEKESIIRVSLEDEKLSEAVYQAQEKRHRRSRTPGDGANGIVARSSLNS